MLKIHPNRRRAGLSLIEVLVAMFIMAIGMISLFVLFPYGALQMLQAVKDDRCAYSADNAHVTAALFWKQIWQTNDGTLRSYPNGVGTAWSGIYAFDDPDDVRRTHNNGLSPAFTWPNPPNAPNPVNPIIFDPNATSYPVFVDVIGWRAHQDSGLAAGRDWIAGLEVAAPPNTNRHLPRRSINALMAAPIPLVIKSSTLLDDINFQSNGSAIDNATNGISRGYEGGGSKYSWAYMLRRLPFSPPHVVNLTVMVFSERRVDNALREEAYPATFIAGSSAVTLQTNGRRPWVRKNGWIMDGSRIGNTQQAKFYRVSGITETATTYEIELDSPAESSSNAAANGVAYIFDSELNGRLIEVFERGKLDASINGYPIP